MVVTTGREIGVRRGVKYENRLNFLIIEKSACENMLSSMFSSMNTWFFEMLPCCLIYLSKTIVWHR